MSAASLLWVALEGAAAPIVAVLRAAGMDYELVTAADALSHLANGHGQVVLCERVRGWPLLVGALERLGGNVILYGPEAPGATSARPALHRVERVEEVSGLPAALARALQRQDFSRPEAPQGPDGASGAELAARLARVIVEQTELHPLVAEATRAAETLVGADAAALFVVDPASGALRFEATAAQVGQALLPLELPSGEGPVEKAAREARPRLLPEASGASGELRGLERFLGFVAGSAAVVPLLLRGDVLGVLLAARRDSRSPLAPEHLERLEHLAGHLAPALHHVQTAAGLRDAQAALLASHADLELRVQQRTHLLARAKQEWEQTFDAIQEPIAIQEGFVVRRANLAYAERVGRPIREVLGKRCHELMAGRVSPCENCPLLGARGGTLAGEVTLSRGDIFQVSGFDTAGAGNAGRFVMHYRDVTGQRQLELRLRESERLAALGQLASGAAHEINNPLGFISSNLASLRGALQDAVKALPSSEKDEDALRELLEDGVQALDESLEGARRVGSIVRGLRELSKLEVGTTVPTDVNASVTRAVRAELGERLGQVVLELRAELPALIQPLQLDQVLGHLLRNATQASRPGQPITVRTSSDEDGVRVEVKDEGVGIPEPNLHRIFEPFFTTRGVGQGLGLGLTAAYGIVQRHGGTLEVRSRPGQGAVFTMKLRTARSASRAPLGEGPPREFASEHSA